MKAGGSSQSAELDALNTLRKAARAPRRKVKIELVPA